MTRKKRHGNQHRNMIRALISTGQYLTCQQSWQWERWAPWLVDSPQATQQRRAPRESARLRSPGRARPEQGMSLKCRVQDYHVLPPRMHVWRGPCDRTRTSAPSWGIARAASPVYKDMSQSFTFDCDDMLNAFLMIFVPPPTSFPLALSTFILVWRTYLYCIQHIEKRWSMPGPSSSTFKQIVWNDFSPFLIFSKCVERGWSVSPFRCPSSAHRVDQEQPGTPYIGQLIFGFTEIMVKIWTCVSLLYTWAITALTACWAS